MKKFLLDTKWIGALSIFIVSFVFAYLASGYAVKAIKAVSPTVVTEASQFLPITIENGAISEPKDTVISKNYGNEAAPLMVVLDTRVDEFSSDDIKNQGMYISRKFIYGVSTQKTEIRSFDSVPNMTIDRQLLIQGADWLETKSGGYIFAAILLSLIIYIGCAVLIYAAIIHLLVGKAMKVSFGRSLRVTTLGYLVLFILATTVVSIGIIVTFVLLAVINYCVDKCYPQKTE